MFWEKFKELALWIKLYFFYRSSLTFEDQLRREASLSQTEIEEIKFKRFKNIVIFSYNHTKFYREHYDRNHFNVMSLKSIDDIVNVPVVTKEHIEKYIEDFRVIALPKSTFIPSVTGGSTGKPVKVYHDRRVALDAFGRYCLTRWGISPSSNAAFLERYNPSSRGLISKVVNHLIWWPTRRVHLDIRNVNEEKLFDFYLDCRKINPIYLEGYVGAVHEFARFLLKHELSLPSVKLVWTTSAPLSESVRDVISRAFRCQVRDQYGCCEINWLAAEMCDCGVLDCFDPFRLIEACDVDGNNCGLNEIGYSVVTDLLNFACPLIRYVNGDRVSFAEKCDVHRFSGAVIKPVLGRISEKIYLPDGGFVPGEFLTTIFDDYPRAVSQFQIIQNRSHDIEILFVKGSQRESFLEFSKAKLSITSYFSGIGLSVRFGEVSSIPHDGGKIRYVISHAVEVS